MNEGRTVFSQLMELAPRYEFQECAKKHAKKVVTRKFSFWDQFLCMAFAQLTYRESLRDIETCLLSLGKKIFSLGLRSEVKRTTLAYANETRNCKVWEDFAKILINKTRKLYAGDKLEFEFENAAYAIDSTTITLCLSLFPWAKYRKKDKAIKIHTQLDLRGNIPSFLLISQAKMADVNFLDNVTLEAGALYILDRGYLDFKRLYNFTLHSCFFVTRLKSKILYRRVQIFSRHRFDAIRMDAAIILLRKESKKLYPVRLRLVEYYDLKTKKNLVFITNNFILSAQTIADIYRARWQVELFFKWIKQNLRIKAFYGNSENAVKTQIWIAVSVYLLVALLKKQLNLDHSLKSILQILSICSTEKIPIKTAFYRDSSQILDPQTSNQLNLFNIPIGQ